MEILYLSIHKGKNKQKLTVTKCMADECEDDLTLNKCGKHTVRPMKTQIS